MRFFFSFFLSLVAALAVLVATAAAKTKPGQEMDPDECGCFLTNGSDPAYYSERMFFDFRSLGEHAGVPDVETSPGDSATSELTSEYFDGDAWADVWDIQGWDNRRDDGTLTKDAKFLMVNSPNNVYIQENDDDDADSDTFLTLRTKRLPKFQSAAEIESSSGDYRFVSYRMLARAVGSPGACAAMFTYRDSDDLADVQEADIEILTGGPRDRIQYTNQPSYTDDGSGRSLPEATRNASLPRGRRWTEWAVHRLDWTPRRSTWYVDGDEAASIAFQVPRDPSHIHLNAWGDGGSWTGAMPVYDEAYLQIQWIEMVYNTTRGADDDGDDNDDDGDGDGKKRARRAKRDDDDDNDEQCSVVCSIDGGQAGVPTLMWESTGSRSTSSAGGGALVFGAVLYSVFFVFGEYLR